MKGRLTDFLSINQAERLQAFSAFELRMQELTAEFEALISASTGSIATQEQLYSDTLATLTADLTAAQNELTTAGGTLAQLTSDISDLEDAVSAYQSTQAGYETALDAYQVTLDGFNTTLTQKTTDFDTQLANQATAFSQLMTDSGNTINQVEQSITGFETRLDEAETTLTGLDETAYTSAKNNYLFRMGTDVEDNWDGIRFDDVTNIFYFKTDTNRDDDSVGGAKLRAQWFGATTNDGSSDVIVRSDRLSWSKTSESQGTGGEVLYDEIMQKSDQAVRVEGDNLALTGDEEVSITWNSGAAGRLLFNITRVEGYRIQDIVHVTLRITTDNLSVSADGDDTINIDFRNYESFFSRLGLFSNVLRTTYGNAMARFSGSGFDTPDIPLVCTVGSNDIAMSNLDRRYFDQPSASITDADIRITFTARVN